MSPATGAAERAPVPPMRTWREAVHGAEDRDGLAHAGLDHADGDADQRLGRGAAAEHVHVEIEADAEIAGDERSRRSKSPPE